ncbi:hypothetical protein ACVWZ8_004910 [Arthrobacter sp. UYCu723]
MVFALREIWDGRPDMSVLKLDGTSPTGRDRYAGRLQGTGQGIREQGRGAEFIKAHALVAVHWVALELMDVTNQGASWPVRCSIMSQGPSLV